VDPILGLLLLWALSRKGGGASLVPTTHAAAPPATGPSAFPPVQAAAWKPPVPSPSVQAGKKWQPYHPLNQAVISRAQQLLHDPSMKVNDERIEPDPASGGTVRYLKTKAPPGKISVTAWKPRAASVPASPGMLALSG
jgi:hypothetical protein